MFQTTIANRTSTEGVGLHTGVYGHLTLSPAPAETGDVDRREADRMGWSRGDR